MDKKLRAVIKSFNGRVRYAKAAVDRLYINYQNTEDEHYKEYNWAVYERVLTRWEDLRYHRDNLKAALQFLKEDEK